MFQDRKILSRLTTNVLSSVNPEFESAIDSQSKDSSLDAKTVNQFLLVLLFLFLRNKFFAILQFIGSLLRDFLEESIPHFQLSTQFYLLIGPDQHIASPVVAAIVEIRVLDESHKEQYQYFSFLIGFSFG